MAPVQDHPPLRLLFRWFNPGVVAINSVQDHLVFVSKARPVRGFPRLFHVNYLLGVIHSDEDISLLLLCRPISLWMG